MNAENKLLLHICCAPDEAAVVSRLAADYALTCFFCNPNIAPQQEYHKRLQEAERVARHFSVPFFADPYAPQTWEDAVAPLASSGEGGARCFACFKLRLWRTAAFCAAQGIGHFTTVMSISPHKKTALLNQAGQEAAAAHGLVYEPFDFKKKDGFLHSIRISRELGLYRQDYCGCRLSKAEREAQKANAPGGL